MSNLDQYAAPQAEPVKQVPFGWLKFDSANPPDEGVYWVHFEAPEIDGDVDNYGRTVDVHTGETEHIIAMAHLITDGEGAFSFHDVDKWNLGECPSLGVARHYMPVVLPSSPGDQAAAPQAEPQPPAPAPDPVATLWCEKRQDLYPGHILELTDAGKALPLGVKHKLYAEPVPCAAPQAEPQPEREPLTAEQLHTVECMDSWAKMQGLPAYSELAGIGTKGGDKP